MYTVFRIDMPNDNETRERIIDSLKKITKERDFDLNDNMISVSVSSEKQPWNHFDEIERKICILDQSDLFSICVRFSIDVSIDRDDLNGRNMWCMSIPDSLIFLLNKHHIGFDVTIYP